MTLAIVDYGSGNLRSAAKAFERRVRERGLDIPVEVTADPEAVAAAERIVLPGVGAFKDCMDGLAAIDGMVAALNEAVIARGRPFLGICVGMQLMASRGREHGVHAGLDWIKGEVGPLLDPNRAAQDGLKIPHMGWNALTGIADHPVLAGIAEGDHAYFVHSYVMRPAEPGQVLAAVDYGGRHCAVVGRDNLIGTQFHPEKSQETGLRLIGNFLTWRP
jgi:glutamine amidotransferase